MEVFDLGLICLWAWVLIVVVNYGSTALVVWFVYLVCIVVLFMGLCLFSGGVGCWVLLI